MNEPRAPETQRTSCEIAREKGRDFRNQGSDVGGDAFEFVFVGEAKSFQRSRCRNSPRFEGALDGRRRERDQRLTGAHAGVDRFQLQLAPQIPDQLERGHRPIIAGFSEGRPADLKLFVDQRLSERRPGERRRGNFRLAIENKTGVGKQSEQFGIRFASRPEGGKSHICCPPPVDIPHAPATGKARCAAAGAWPRGIRKAREPAGPTADATDPRRSAAADYRDSGRKRPAVRYAPR